MNGAGATIVTGTDSGNPLTLHGPSIYSEMEAMRDAGVPAADVANFRKIEWVMRAGVMHVVSDLSHDVPE